MQLSGLRYGSKLLQLVEFPVAEFIDGSATNPEIQQFLEKHKKPVVKPAFNGGVGKKGKAGLVRVVGTLQEALQAKRDLFFAQHAYGSKVVTANGVTMEAFVPSDLEVYFSIMSSSVHRGPVFTITPWGGVDIEELAPEKKPVVEIDPFTGTTPSRSPTPSRTLAAPNPSSRPWSSTSRSCGSFTTATASRPSSSTPSGSSARATRSFPWPAT